MIPPSRARSPVAKYTISVPTIPRSATPVPASARTVDHGLGHRWRREPHVAADRHAPRLELLRERPADRIGTLLVELRRIERAHVVGLEGAGVDHRLDAS
jgi:hypothetical protein